MFEKHLWKSDILSKDTGRWPEASPKMPLFDMFSNILLVKTNYLVLFVSETLVENGLIFQRRLWL